MASSFLLGLQLNAFMLIVLVACLSSSDVAASPDTGDRSCIVKAIYSFGDSIADTGNLIRLGIPGMLSSTFRPPYGTSWPGMPTGRCSDGRLMIDYFAQLLRLPLPPPYLNSGANFSQGVNFAVAGATALDRSFFLQKGFGQLSFANISLDVQLEWFKQHMNTLCSSKPDCTKQFKKALFFVGEIGGNDYNYGLILGKPLTLLKTIVPDVIAKIVDTSQQLIDAGAVHLVIPGNFPIGCAPIFLTIRHSDEPAAYDENKCLKELNSFSEYHNQQLQSALDTLRANNPSVTIMYADYFNAYMTILQKAGPLGFNTSSTLKACCGDGGQYNFNLNRMCGYPGLSVCRYPSTSISWDGIHLTQQAYKTMVGLLTLGGYTYPNNQLWEQWVSAAT